MWHVACIVLHTTWPADIGFIVHTYKIVFFLKILKISNIYIPIPECISHGDSKCSTEDQLFDIFGNDLLSKTWRQVHPFDGSVQIRFNMVKLKEYYEIVGESRPLSAFFPTHADLFTEMHF